MGLSDTSLSSLFSSASCCVSPPHPDSKHPHVIPQNSAGTVGTVQGRWREHALGGPGRTRRWAQGGTPCLRIGWATAWEGVGNSRTTFKLQWHRCLTQGQRCLKVLRTSQGALGAPSPRCSLGPQRRACLESTHLACSPGQLTCSHHSLFFGDNLGFSHWFLCH